ncbi:MAG: hypothetical protein GVY30_11250 [Chloroflexi bacterium]|nr:hypothetical protein [Chloroflexota bacterium]
MPRSDIGPLHQRGYDRARAACILRRWRSQPPRTGNPQSLNRYAYVKNNPLRYVDPSGHIPCIDDECQWDEHPDSHSPVPIAGIPDHYSFSIHQWESIQNEPQ